MESGNNLSATDNGSSSDSKTPCGETNYNHVSRSHPLSSRSSSSSGEVIELDNSAETSTSNAAINTVGSSMPNSATEQNADVSPSPTTGRIPSYVFARKNSSGNMEWSVASNESLFSIHMGNMSFTRDQLSWTSKSGELGWHPDHPTFSGPLIDLPSSLMEANRISFDEEITVKSGGDLKEEGSPTLTEEAAAETMWEVMREKESQAKDITTKESPHSRSLSQHSDLSVKSFAFPILTGDAQRSCSFRPSNTKHKKLMSKGSSPKTTPQSPPETPQPQTPRSQPPPPSPPKDQTKNPAGPARWFSCFPCCPSCS